MMIIHKPKREEYVTYYQKYVEAILEEDLCSLLTRQAEEIITLLETVSEEQSSYRYAQGKWSIKEVLGHITDTERIMSYRLLRIGRGDTTDLAGFDENVYVEHASYERLSMQQLLNDFSAVRHATISLIRILPEEAWTRSGTANGGPVTARALAYIIAGHALHHKTILLERYLEVL